MKKVEGPPVEMPSRATFYRLFNRLEAGRHTTGSARTRRSLANQPDGVFDQVTVCRPGELMEIDSTPFDVLVRLENGIVDRCELVGMVDVATRTITAAVLRPTTKSVDAALLLARSVTPAPMRPGWPEALRMEHSALPYERLLSVDERLRHAAAVPLIIPETVVVDGGKAFLSKNFHAACNAFGTEVIHAPPRTPTHKPHSWPGTTLPVTFGTRANRSPRTRLPRPLATCSTGQPVAPTRRWARSNRAGADAVGAAAPRSSPAPRPPASPHGRGPNPHCLRRPTRRRNPGATKRPKRRTRSLMSSR